MRDGPERYGLAGLEMATTVLLIRHGQTAWNADGRIQGHTDVPLDEIGREQARLLAQRLAAWPVTALYSSDLRRASETAAILAGAWGLEPVNDAAWRERHWGIYQGLTGPELAEQFPAFWDELQKGTFNPPEGETTQALYRRVNDAFDRLVAAHRGEVVAVVSHGGTLRMLIGRVLGLSAGCDPPIRLRGNTGLSIVEVVDGQPPVLTRMNDTSHLEQNERHGDCD